jgi:hypothetical protein
MKPRAQRGVGTGERAKDVLQIVGILCIGAFFAVIANRAYGIFTALAARYSGAEFWIRFVRYVIASIGS